MTDDLLPPSRFCKSCETVKPESEFYPPSKGNSKSRCKICSRKRNTEYWSRPENRARMLQKGKLYRSKEANKIRARERGRSPRYRAYQLIWMRRTAEVRNAKSREVYAVRKNSPDFRRKQRAAWHLRRAREKGNGGQFNGNDIAELLRAQRGKCAICRKRLQGKYEIDHIIPLARGGANRRSNLQILCSPCNRSKNVKDPIDYMRSVGRLL